MRVIDGARTRLSRAPITRGLDIALVPSLGGPVDLRSKVRATVTGAPTHAVASANYLSGGPTHATSGYTSVSVRHSVRMPPTLAVTGAPVTLAAWASPNSIGTFQQNIVSLGSATPNYAGIRLSTSTTNVASVTLGDNSGAVFATSTRRRQSSTISNLKWYLIVGVYPGGSALPDLYVNGRLDNASIDNNTSGDVAYQGTDMLVGGIQLISNTTQYWRHEIGPVLAWSRALDAMEIAALYDPATRWDWLEDPSNRTYFLPAAGGGGFQPAWARNSNRVIGIAA